MRSWASSAAARAAAPRCLACLRACFLAFLSFFSRNRLILIAQLGHTFAHPFTGVVQALAGDGGPVPEVRSRHRAESSGTPARPSQVALLRSSLLVQVRPDFDGLVVSGRGERIEQQADAGSEHPSVRCGGRSRRGRLVLSVGMLAIHRALRCQQRGGER